MPQVNGFVFDRETGDISMYAGDTGSFFVLFERESGDSWPDTARLLFTVKNGQGDIVMQRLYRLDNQWDLGDGIVMFEFHNDDTDTWEPGQYTTEMRINLDPIWEGTPSSSRCVDQLGPGTHAEMVEGVPVRTVFKGTLTINSVDGRI